MKMVMYLYIILECPQGKFGEDCARTCDMCKNKNCHHMTGLCQEGCGPGWLSPRCDKGNYRPFAYLFLVKKIPAYLDYIKTNNDGYLFILSIINIHFLKMSFNSM